MNDRVKVADLKAALEYNSETGGFIWKARTGCTRSDRIFNAQRAGRAAFTSISPAGYLVGSFGGNRGTKIFAHRAAWAFYHGSWPKGEIDHINGIKTDNRIANLRDVLRTENARNMPISTRNRSGIVGVSQFKGAWRASIGINGQAHYLGTFKSIEEAIEVRAEAARSLGYHENHGRSL